MVLLATWIGLVAATVGQAQSAETHPTPSQSPAKHHTKKAGTSTEALTAATPSTNKTAAASSSNRSGHKKATETVGTTTTAPPVPERPTPAPAKNRKRNETTTQTSVSPPAKTPSPSLPRLNNESANARPDQPAAPLRPTPATAAGHGRVWVNTKTHVYHREGSRFYGKTAQGKYVTEQEALKEGDRPAKE